MIIVTDYSIPPSYAFPTNVHLRGFYSHTRSDLRLVNWSAKLLFLLKNTEHSQKLSLTLINAYATRDVAKFRETRQRLAREDLKPYFKISIKGMMILFLFLFLFLFLILFLSINLKVCEQ